MRAIKDRVFVQHIPGCVEADPYVARYSTWNDLERMIRGRGHTGRLGYDDYQGKERVLIMDIFESDGKVQWWVIGTAWNPPGDPPWPYWKEVVRELGGRI